MMMMLVRLNKQAVFVAEVWALFDAMTDNKQAAEAKRAENDVRVHTGDNRGHGG